MKKIKLFILVAALIGFISCDDTFLTNHPTQSQEAGGAATEGAILSNLGACYQILLFDSYAANNYNSIPLMSDLRSDDIYKGGGDAGDQATLYRLSQLDVTPTELPYGIWQIYFSGISRCNNVLLACSNAVNVTAPKLAQYQAEAHFLRAYYTHWLWKFWGNIPYFENDIPAPYMVKQMSADSVYAKIIADLNYAIDGDKLPMRVTKANDGRVSKAAAIMLKSRAVMYQKDQTRYAEVLADLNSIVTSKQYKLVDNFAGMWLNTGEFCDESIFESNQLPKGKTWASGWQGFGTNLPAFISPNNLVDTVYNGGWGFAPVRTQAWAMYETGDKRREASINHFEDGTYTPRFQSTGYFLGKYAARKGYNPPPGDQDLNYDNNVRIFRYAEVLLNIADLQVIEGVAPGAGITAQECLDMIRTRAGSLASIPATAANIKLERRREFLGEGMRFWDLVRWGDASILTENIPAFSTNRTWKDTDKLLPIPQSEIEKTEGAFKLVQNPGYN
ncbi:MAG: RagB/SusD family nutrient uptake outer membrane protein [Paludibacter sp.]|nr:RagB/SusD family nutrient uptake outer membrane protein [Paludibacter sp.]